MRHTGLLRLDHVMGLHRLWWVPSGGSAADGAYVSYNAEELYAVLCLESHRHQTALIGENLGTVPPAVIFFQAEDGIRDVAVTGVQTCALPISRCRSLRARPRRHAVLRATAEVSRLRSAGAVWWARCFRFQCRSPGKAPTACAVPPPRKIGRASCRERV